MRDCSFTGPALRPAARGPVALGAVETGDLELADPLGRRDVAVQTGHHHAHGEAVLDRQRFAVHADREERVAVVGEGLEGAGCREPVDRAREHHVGLGGRFRAGEDVADGHAEPARGADEGAAHLVRDAHEGRDGLLLGEGDQVVPPQHDLLLDETVHAQGPGRGVHLGHDERGVDAVEVRGGRDHRREPVDAEVGGGGEPSSWWPAWADAAPLGSRSPLAHPRSARRTRRWPSPRPARHARKGEHTAARDAVVGGGLRGTPAEPGDQQPGHQSGCRPRHERGQGRQRPGIRPRHRDDRADHTQCDEDDSSPRAFRRSSTPATPATISSSTAMPTSRAALSPVPNRSIARFLPRPERGRSCRRR